MKYNIKVIDLEKLDDLEEYTNSSEHSRIRCTTVEFGERDHYHYV